MRILFSVMIMLSLVACGSTPTINPNFNRQMEAFERQQVANAQRDTARMATMNTLAGACAKDDHSDSAALCAALIASNLDSGSGGSQQAQLPSIPQEKDPTWLRLVGIGLGPVANAATAILTNQQNNRTSRANTAVIWGNVGGMVGEGFRSNTRIAGSGFDALEVVGSRDSVSVTGDYIVGNGNATGNNNVLGNSNVLGNENGDGARVSGGILGNDNGDGPRVGDGGINGDGNGDGNGDNNGDDNSILNPVEPPVVPGG